MISCTIQTFGSYEISKCRNKNMGGIFRPAQQNKEKGLEKWNMNKKKEATREDARRILRNGILDMNVERLIQLSHYGLMGNIALSSETLSVDNVFNRVSYDEESRVITFSANESQSSSYSAVSFSAGVITEISGCEDEEYPEEFLNVNIKLEDGIAINIRILY